MITLRSEFIFELCPFHKILIILLCLLEGSILGILSIPSGITKKNFEDLESFHIFGTCVVNEHYFATKENNFIKKRKKFYETIHKKKVQGVNAMSISEITGIPRATVIRKLKKMVSSKCLMIDNKKHYYLTESFVKKLMPLQEVTLNRLADFSSKIYNLKIL